MAISEKKSPGSDARSCAPQASVRRRGIRVFMDKNRRALSALLVFVVMMLVFTMLNPKVFLNPLLFKAILRTLPIWIILASSLVFVIAAGEIDLSFVAIKTVATWTFAATAAAGWNPFLGMIFALAVGAGAGFLNGVIVTRIGLSSLVSTIGMQFFLRGLINVGTQGEGIPLTHLKGTPFYSIFIGSTGGFPIHIVWGLAFAVIGVLLFNYHKFGARICCVGDNLESAREMGINTARVKTLAFVYVGLAAGLASILLTLSNQTFYPTTGDTLDMIVLASAFIGGTPTWGGVGTIVGAVFGACTVGIIGVGIVAAGVSHLYKTFFYGLTIVLALIGHKFHESRHRF
jgi:ribose/xylose/arabinose/galactoside ABC-type transport system permease subunit